MSMTEKERVSILPEKRMEKSCGPPSQRKRNRVAHEVKISL